MALNALPFSAITVLDNSVGTAATSRWILYRTCRIYVYRCTYDQYRDKGIGCNCLAK